ncbi:branched-chain amino acid aminotransferase [Hydrogenoanaerobacterium saccharovorans]|uniref:Branched-chain-amino-acid aminotransferase n=1 Tax=Hydrogenoanaerobacterium saccharovorans TaxID=474960 RepID=A0A1H8A4P1_9FIRM|nr:branched-chain amino acid aminotransferase [Hydrogenoanaerobacterium saccharovorans]RPF48214.1 branched-chain amino acid aminotransferase [Hydrogenoanaerobacterium saccharovorans]SEM64759.1 branched-chain amino acid aminotransferase [Hydrogenoanaerobacterium saccharovorans]
MSNIQVELAKTLKTKPTDEGKLGFGEIFTDHMFLMDYTEGKGWHDPRIVPYGPIPMDPSAMCLHYGQTVFEGMKAYRTEDNRILMFRPWENFKRLNQSNDRLQIPAVDEKLLLEGLEKLIEIEKDWVPHTSGASLYIRPFIIATEPKLGVKPSSKYLYVVVLSPSGPYYKSGLNPVKIYIETQFVRAVKGGTGAAKCGGNYASGLKAQEIAHEQGYSQVLWTDGIEHKYIEEVGAMNVFFVIDDEIVTPELVGSILPGITRKSSIEMLRGWGYKVSERRLSVQELEDAYQAGKVKEAFGTGTAAVISPIGELKVGDYVMTFNDGKIGTISQKLYDNLTGIQYGKLPDTHSWMDEVCKG